MSYLDDDTLQVYIASAHGNAYAARDLAQRLEALGCEIVSKWTTRPLGWNTDMSEEVRAVHDISELQSANIYVGLITEDSLTTHAEFGFALAKGVECFVTSVDKEDLPFEEPSAHLDLLMYHPDVHRCESTADIVERLFLLLRAKIVACDVCGRDMVRQGGMLECKCGATRERSPMAWMDELQRGHQATCSQVPLIVEDKVVCAACQGEWQREDSGEIVFTATPV